MEERCDSSPPGVDLGAVSVLTGSWYWKKCGNANQVWIEPVSSLAATSYRFASRSLVSGLAGCADACRAARSRAVPRSSVSQSLKTSRTIIVFAPGSAT